jgi:N-acylneuraminate cytidylyltransferase
VDGLAEPYNAPRQVLPATYWQTGHIDAIRTSTIADKHSLTGDVIYPLMIDPKYTVDIDTLADWLKYEALVYSGLEMASPGKARRAMPETIKLIVTDFDGVLSDGRVWVDETGRETVAASRSDSMRVKEMRARGMDVIVLSSETNPVVSVRAKKMGIEAIQGMGLADKGDSLKKYLTENKIDASQVVYLGNDFNDLPCFEIAGWSVAVADAYPEVLRAADHVLKTNGGFGALRELCDLILTRSDRA